MSHGAGGKATHKLIEGLFLPALANPALAPLSDAALLSCGDARLALTTDAFVVRPLVFPATTSASVLTLLQRFSSL